MQEIAASLHQFSFSTVAVRLLISAAAGGVLGYGRARRKRAAGLRTYMLTSIGAALSMIISFYEYEMFTGPWAGVAAQVGLKFDGSRYSSSVITGIGFLAAGTIISAAHQQVSGLTTATGLFTAACIGIAGGMGFYSCVFIVTVVTALVLNAMAPLERRFKRRHRNIDLYVEFYNVEDLTKIISLAESLHAHVFDLNMERTERTGDKYPSALIVLQLGKDHTSHSEMLSAIASLPCVHTIQELIA